MCFREVITNITSCQFLQKSFLLNTFVKKNNNKDCSFLHHISYSCRWHILRKCSHFLIHVSVMEISKKRTSIRISLYSTLHIWYIFCKKKNLMLAYFNLEKLFSYHFSYEKLKLSYDIDYLCKALPKSRAHFRLTCFEYYIIETIKFE